MGRMDNEHLFFWFAKHAPVQYNEVYTDMSGLGQESELDARASNLMDLAVRMIRMAVYLEARTAMGMSHEKAVDKQNRVARNVRKALGYSYPRQDYHF